MGLLSRQEVKCIAKRQRKEDDRIIAGIQGVGDGQEPGDIDMSGRGSGTKQEGDRGGFGAWSSLCPAGTGPVCISHRRSRDIIEEVDAQQAAVPGLTADRRLPRGARRVARLQEDGGPQHLQYVGGDGGSGKSRSTPCDEGYVPVERRQGTPLLTWASGNAATLISSVTIHSAVNIGFEGSRGAGSGDAERACGL